MCVWYIYVCVVNVCICGGSYIYGSFLVIKICSLWYCMLSIYIYVVHVCTCGVCMHMRCMYVHVVYVCVFHYTLCVLMLINVHTIHVSVHICEHVSVLSSYPYICKYVDMYFFYYLLVSIKHMSTSQDNTVMRIMSNAALHKSFFKIVFCTCVI